MGEKSRVLVVGATGNMGSHLVRSSLAAGHPTFAFFRESATSDPRKSQLLHSFADAGATLLKGSLEDYESLIDAVKKVDVVISAVSSAQVLDQKLLIRAIKHTGCIKRFFPSEFGADADKVQVIGIDHDFYERKAEIRRLIKEEKIPYTYVCSHFYTSYLLPSLIQPGLNSPPKDKIKIYGDGNTKAVFVKECDVATFTICTVDDPRSLNKVLYLRPSGNVCSINDIVEMWESKIGRKLQREYVSEDQVLKNIKELPYAEAFHFIFIYRAFIKGDHTYFDIDPSHGLDGAQIYYHVKHTTVNEFLNTLSDS